MGKAVTGVDDALAKFLVEFRRDLHRHPELAFEEKRTSARVQEELRKLGYAPRAIAGTGVLAAIDGAAPGPHVMLRGDMDALPLTERTGLPHASVTPNVMHACGHDAHTAMVLGAAALLKRQPPARGRVSFLFQPAEERNNGAKRVVDEGGIAGVAAMFALHVDPRLDCGALAAEPGYVSANLDSLQIDVQGKAGHAARPHLAVDAIVIAAQLVTMLQSIVSRQANPGTPAVLTIGKIAGGTASNVIADHVILHGTMRTLHPATRDTLHRGVLAACEAMSRIPGARVLPKITPGNPAVLNDAGLVAMARGVIAELLGPGALVPPVEINMASEDFSYYLDTARGCYLRLGVRRPGVENAPVHSPEFDLNEDALPAGAAVLAALARKAVQA